MDDINAKNVDSRSIDGLQSPLYTSGARISYWRNHFHLLVGMALVPIFVAVYILGYWLRFEGQLGERELQSFRATVGWVVLAKLAWFMGLRVSRGWSRLVTFYDLSLLVRAATLGTATIALIYYLLVPLPVIPRSVLVFDWGATIVVVGGLRSLLRGWRETYWLLSRPAGQVRVLIAGAGETGALMLRAIHQTGSHKYRVAGFLARNAKLIGTRIEGVPVLGTFKQVNQIVPRYGVKQVLVVQGEILGRDLRKLMEDAKSRHFDVRLLPSYRQLIDGSLTVQPRAVSIEDLLQRKPVKLDIEDIRQWVDARNVLVTGSAGSIGAEICRQLLQFSPRRIVAVDRSETGQFFLEHELRAMKTDVHLDLQIADILDEYRLRDVLRRCRPEVIFHAAAYKHVPLMENNPGEAVKNIVTGTRQMADLARQYGVGSFVMISTDKAVNPTSVMGACKRVAELYVQSLTGTSPCRFVTVRFGNVLDSAGSVLQLFRRQILSGGPVTITHPEIRRYFMTIPEAARLVIQAGAIGQHGQILLLDMGEPIRIVDLAADMIRLSGLEMGRDINIEFIGLRPGEKMFEELYGGNEQRLPTRHPKIIIAESQPVQPAALLKSILELERIASTDPQKIPAFLQSIVPEYRMPIKLMSYGDEYEVPKEHRQAA
jgi:FlaA1/EpsC-like NDP-sugar epimerase